jgi:hypothetical protein
LSGPKWRHQLATFAGPSRWGVRSTTSRSRSESGRAVPLAQEPTAPAPAPWCRLRSPAAPLPTPGAARRKCPGPDRTGQRAGGCSSRRGWRQSWAQCDVPGLCNPLRPLI